MPRLVTAFVLALLAGLAQADDPASARDIIRRAMDHYRGQTSFSELTMTIHRPDWERSMSMRAWSRGDDESLVRVVAPARDAGNGTLTLEGNMWTFTPKINRVIKVPSSLMSQNWMGSDFSNRDISKDTAIIDEYDHRLLETRELDGHRAWVIESIPHEDAPVVWGKEVLVIRDDWVLLEQQFWDQDGELVKTLKAQEISSMGGREVASRLRMQQADKPQEWTEVVTAEVEFDLELPEGLFTLSSLRNPRR
ncbi:outer membrane lipoprotein-sorting protein [Mangrovimicrobium sediminis]|uniref:Outer membrane lipoprotein-sorting protein n=1 Tax=Mangrovimicrobium sediminis TaxID=2562682 RepID=A0A4Z0LWW1_9GAMM|nr:outer membrane lipoprotein-sorting protein [Haliea sp. SAOS-164]TGD71842.1 outer membrane lipoprotein-sorting protein [Haliea sp. SAOS-164]